MLVTLCFCFLVEEEGVYTLGTNLGKIFLELQISTISPNIYWAIYLCYWRVGDLKKIMIFPSNCDENSFNFLWGLQLLGVSPVICLGTLFPTILFLDSIR